MDAALLRAKSEKKPVLLDFFSIQVELAVNRWLRLRIQMLK